MTFREVARTSIAVAFRDGFLHSLARPFIRSNVNINRFLSVAPAPEFRDRRGDWMMQCPCSGRRFWPRSSMLATSTPKTRLQVLRERIGFTRPLTRWQNASLVLLASDTARPSRAWGWMGCVLLFAEKPLFSAGGDGKRVIYRTRYPVFLRGPSSDLRVRYPGLDATLCGCALLFQQIDCIPRCASAKPLSLLSIGPSSRRKKKRISGTNLYWEVECQDSQRRSGCFEFEGKRRSV